MGDDKITVEALARLENCDDPRLKLIMTSVITHLHAVVREVEPTLEEWGQAIKFLTQVGHWCDDTRQEFILLSDTLAVSMLVDTLALRKPESATRVPYWALFTCPMHLNYLLVPIFPKTESVNPP